MMTHILQCATTPQQPQRESETPDRRPLEVLPEVMPRKPISERRLAANRANALKSTGPRTKAGKVVVRVNAITHGLLASMPVVLSSSGLINTHQFNQLVRQLREDFVPQTQLEMTLIESLAFDLMRLSMIHGLSALFFADLYERAEEPGVPVMFMPPPLPEGSSKEQVRHENEVAGQMLRALEARQQIQLSPSDAEAMARQIFDAVDRNIHKVCMLRESLGHVDELLSTLAPPSSEATPSPPGAGATQTRPVPENTQKKLRLEENRAGLVAEIEKLEQSTIKNMGLDSPQDTRKRLEDGVCVPEDRSPLWAGIVGQIVQNTGAILKSLEAERKKRDGKQIAALRMAIDHLPRLENLSRYEATIRRAVERTLNQLQKVRHELFA